MDEHDYSMLSSHLSMAIMNASEAGMKKTYHEICKQSALISIAESLIVIADLALQKEKERLEE